MNKVTIIEESKIIKIDKEPLVLMPLRLWQKFEESLENYFENEEALGSKRFLRRVKQTRKEIGSKKLIFPFE